MRICERKEKQIIAAPLSLFVDAKNRERRKLQRKITSRRLLYLEHDKENKLWMS
jgi:hypothetical protein